jgi:hypothetical protein
VQRRQVAKNCGQAIAMQLGRRPLNYPFPPSILERMAIPVEKLTEAMLELPSDARALLADRLVESLDPLIDEDVRALWASEALRRRDEVRSGQMQTIPADVVRERIRALLKK